ncbi:MAG: hypothetical protein AB7F96_06885 [Beijerinckiaceae bacterium]
MVKIAIVLLGVTLAVSKFAGRWMPAEVKQAARIMSWLLAAYVAVMLALGVVALLRPGG